jgi:hypothetical protein
MKTKHFLNAFVILISLLFLTACNENGRSSNVAEGGIGGTGMSVGPISAFGSIFVNGIKFETDDAIIIANGQPVTENDLKIGMVVRVEGTIDLDSKTGNASRIDFNENVRGPVQSVDDETQTLIVLGQTVAVDQLTILDGLTELTDLNVGDIVNVSGLVNADGTIHATWIARESHVVEFEVVGQVTNLDLATQTFTIGDLTIDYNQTLILEFPNGVPNNGLLVEVKGTFADTVAGKVLMASRVETEDDLFSRKVGTRIEIEGFITQFNNRFEFEVAQLSVTTTPQTVFQFGRADDLALGVKVEVEGKLDANGVLVLEEVSFKSAASFRTPAGRIEIEADVEAIALARQQITLLGLSIQATHSTQFVDRRDARVPFGLPDLSLGDRVAMSGFLDLTTNTLMAEVLLREPFRVDEQVALEGPVAQIDAKIGTLAILGITVQTDTDTIYEDERLSPSDTIITAEQFFATIQQSELLIEAQGILMGKILFANRLEIEP